MYIAVIFIAVVIKSNLFPISSALGTNNATVAASQSMIFVSKHNEIIILHMLTYDR